MANNAYLDAEQGTHVSPSLVESLNSSNLPKNSDGRRETYVRKFAGAFGYIFQIIYQVAFLFLFLCCRLVQVLYNFHLTELCETFWF